MDINGILFSDYMSTHPPFVACQDNSLAEIINFHNRHPNCLGEVSGFARPAAKCRFGTHDRRGQPASQHVLCGTAVNSDSKIAFGKQLINNQILRRMFRKNENDNEMGGPQQIRIEVKALIKNLKRVCRGEIMIVKIVLIWTHVQFRGTPVTR